MAEIKKRLLIPSRRRAVPASGFSWIDRRLVRDDFLSQLTGPEALLYFFLVVVADQDGLSYYGDRRTAAMLKLSEVALDNARRGLKRKDLIQYRAPLYQVLSLPDIRLPRSRPRRSSRHRRRQCRPTPALSVTSSAACSILGIQALAVTRADRHLPAVPENHQQARSDRLLPRRPMTIMHLHGRHDRSRRGRRHLWDHRVFTEQTQFWRRIMVRETLTGLSEDEVLPFLDHHFEAQGKRLCERGLRALFERSKGAPGVMLPMYRTVLSHAAPKGKIEANDVEETLERWELP